MDLLHLVDRLEELVASAQKMPIGNRAIIDRRRLLDIIDQMRIAVPHEVREAREIVERQDELRREAEEEARMIVARAEEHASRLVEAHEITEGARRRAAEVAAQAEIRLEERVREANAEMQERLEDSRRLARQQMDAADDYARELLVRLERQLQAFVRSVRSGIDQLEPEEDDDDMFASLPQATITPVSRPPSPAVREEEERDEPEDELEAEPPEVDRSWSQAREPERSPYERPRPAMEREEPTPLRRGPSAMPEPRRDEPRDEPRRDEPREEPRRDQPFQQAPQPYREPPRDYREPPRETYREPPRDSVREAPPAPQRESPAARPAEPGREPFRPAREEPHGDDDELENLLRPRRRRDPEPLGEAGDDVIDDFANPPLDDDPIRGDEPGDRPGR